MLSRRNIRVKVMQTLYSIESLNHETEIGRASKILENTINDTQALLAYVTSYMIAVTAYAEKSAIRRANKYLPDESDLSVNTKIVGNSIIGNLNENSSYQKIISNCKTRYLIDNELVKRIFTDLSASEDYDLYVRTQSRSSESERKILEVILENYLIGNEDFMSSGEEIFIHWNDDLDVALDMIRDVLKNPASFNFLEKPDEEKLIFGKNLLKTVIEKNDYCIELIKPKLLNWEAERIAVIDMILLKMGICEILYFETIPVKVTLNEYIDIAKEYSTEKSGHFLNGILDNILKDLLVQNKIHKKKYKRIT